MSNLLKQEYGHAFKVWRAAQAANPLAAPVEPRVPGGLTPDEARRIREAILSPPVPGPIPPPPAFASLMRKMPWVSWWRLNDTGEVGVDQLGRNNGTYHNSPARGIAADIFTEPAATGIKLVGADKQGLVVPDSSSLHLGDTFTLAAHFEANAGDTNRTLIAKGAGGFALRQEEGGTLELLQEDTLPIAYTIGAVVLGQKNFIMVTKDGEEVHMILNGIDVTLISHTPTVENTTEPLLIGFAGTVASPEEAGDFALVSDVAVSGEVLTVAEARALTEALLGPPPPLIFNGDTKAIFEAQGIVQEQEPSRITEVSDPLGSGETVFKVICDDDDLPESDLPRAQLSSGEIIVPGGEYWVSTAFLIPDGFMTDLPGCQFFETPYGLPFGGPPPVAFGTTHFGESGIPLMGWQRNSTYAYDFPYGVPIREGVWINLLYHFKYSEQGFVEWWINGEPITFFAPGTSFHNVNDESPTQKLMMKTRDASNGTGSDKAIIQQYRPKTTGGSPEKTCYIKPLLVGTTRASVGG